MSKRQVSARGRGDFLKITPNPPSEKKSRKIEKKKPLLMKVGVQMDPDVYFELKKRAATERKKLYELLNEAVTQYLARKR